MISISIGNPAAASCGDGKDVTLTPTAVSFRTTGLQHECDEGIAPRPQSPAMCLQHSASLRDNCTPGRRHSVSAVQNNETITAAARISLKGIKPSIRLVEVNVQTD